MLKGSFSLKRKEPFHMRVNSEIMKNYLQKILEEIWNQKTFESKFRDDGWEVTGHDKNNTYVAFNKYKSNKVVYQIQRQGNKVNLKLFVSNNNPCVDNFRNKVSANGDNWFENSRDCGVSMSIEISFESDHETAIGSIFEGLNKLYTDYNEIVSEGLSDEIEEMLCLQLSPKYELSWTDWDTYYGDWDKFVKKWYDGRGGADESFQNIVKSGNCETELDMTEFPEPYYGCGEKAKCVIVHLNPGASSENENEKRLGICAEKDGRLIQSFAKTCELKYSTYAKKWSPLKGVFDDCNNASDVPGYDWWHNRNRTEWFKKFWGIREEQIIEIFALEACPYHSKGWSGSLERIEEHIIEKVITPAAIVANRNKNCAVFVGSGFNTIIAKVKDVEVLGRWRGTRVYSLYRLKFPQEKGGVLFW